MLSLFRCPSCFSTRLLACDSCVKGFFIGGVRRICGIGVKMVKIRDVI